MLGSTIAQSAPDLGAFAVLSSILFMGFAGGAHLLFYTEKEYMSLKQTMSSLTSAFLGTCEIYRCYYTTSHIAELIYMLISTLLSLNISLCLYRF